MPQYAAHILCGPRWFSSGDV